MNDNTWERHPGVDVRRSSAEHLPFPNATFDAALAQLVVHFMKNPVAGIAEMGRVTRRGGIVAACVWDHGGGQGPLRIFWDAARTLDPEIDGESHLPGVREGHLAELFGAAGLREIESTALSVSLEHPTFDAWWEPFTRGVGPAGAHLASLDAGQRITLREECRRRVPSEPFMVTAVAWVARGLA